MTNTETTITATDVRNATPGQYVGIVGTKFHTVWSLDGNTNCASVRRGSHAHSVTARTEVADVRCCGRCAGGTAPAKAKGPTVPAQDMVAVRAALLAEACGHLGEYADMLARNAANPEAVANLAPKVAQYAARVAELSA